MDINQYEVEIRN